MKFNIRLLNALDGGCVIEHVPGSLDAVLLDTNHQPCETEAQPEFAEFLELVMRCKIDPVDQIESGPRTPRKGVEFYQKHSCTPLLATTLP